MNLYDEAQLERLRFATRRHFLTRCGIGLGSAWLASQGRATEVPTTALKMEDGEGLHFRPKAKRVIFLHMAGSPSQLEMFDFKPTLRKLDGTPCPKSFMEGKRFGFTQGRPDLLGPVYPFERVGESGCWMSDRLPHLKHMADKLCVVRSMKTSQFNHAPAQLLLHTGNANFGAASMGSWVTYGLGTANRDLPGFVVLVSGGRIPSSGKSAWGSGYLPSVYQGVQCRSHGDPVLFLSAKDGASRAERAEVLKTIEALNKDAYQEFGDPETLTRIAQYELAFRMQVSANEAFDIASESQKVHEDYGVEPGKESFGNNCLLARRLAERDVRFIQLFHWGWDSHGASPSEALDSGFKDRCRETDKPIAALLRDLDERGLLEDTLVIWGGEFGRTPMRENRNGRKMKHIGRDHHPGAFTMWLAGGGVKSGLQYGETDELGYDVVADPVTPHDLHATILSLLGIDHQRLTFNHQGANQRLSNLTKPSRVVHEIVS